jgi:hypothetical protein
LEVRLEENRPLGRPRSRREEKIKTDIQAEGWGVMDWIDRTQDRDRWRVLVKAVMKLRIP